MNDILCNVISRSCLCTEDESDRSFRFLSVFDFQIFIDNIKSIQLLTFILMKSLDLDIKNGLFSSISIPVFSRTKSLQIFFAFVLISSSLIQNLLIILVSQEASSVHRHLSYNPSPISEEINLVSGWLQYISQRRKVIPLVLLLNFSG